MVNSNGVSAVAGESGAGVQESFATPTQHRLKAEFSCLGFCQQRHATPAQRSATPGSKLKTKCESKMHK